MRLGSRYTQALGLVPDLKAGTSSEEELKDADFRIVEMLRAFSPNISRRSEDFRKGVYLLDVSGLESCFGTMDLWSRKILKAFRSEGWDIRLVVGFTAFATDLAAHQLTAGRAIKFFQSRQIEEKETLQSSLSTFSLPREDVFRLRSFDVLTLGELLGLGIQEVKRRFGNEVLEFYQKACGGIFTLSSPIPEPEPLLASIGFSHALSHLAPLLLSIQKLLRKLLPKLLRKEQSIAAVKLQLFTEGNGCQVELLRPATPTADLEWIQKLIKLRLEKSFRKKPLRRGHRIERLILELAGAQDSEEQGELFSDWAFDILGADEKNLLPRDIDAGVRALSLVRAEFGDHCLVRASLREDYRPGFDYEWVSEKEDREWFRTSLPGKSKKNHARNPNSYDKRVRRIVSQKIRISKDCEWDALHGPYLIDCPWYSEPCERSYFFAQKGQQTAWLYKEKQNNLWQVQGWLQ